MSLFSRYKDWRYDKTINKLEGLRVELSSIEQAEKDKELCDIERKKLLNKKEKIKDKIKDYRIRVANIGFARSVEKKSMSKDMDIREAVIHRSQAKSNLIDNFVEIYTKRLKRKELLKIWFFVITMTFFLGVLSGTFYFLKGLIDKAENLSSWEFVPGCVTGIIGFVTTFLVLPKIIGEYLYDSSENEEISSLLKYVFKSDQEAAKNILNGKQETEREGSSGKVESVVDTRNMENDEKINSVYDTLNKEFQAK